MLHSKRQTGEGNTVRKVRRSPTPGRSDSGDERRIHIPVQTTLQAVDSRSQCGTQQRNYHAGIRGEVEKITICIIIKIAFQYFGSTPQYW